MGKPNWCCSFCGDHFSRRFSANRHIRLKHGGLGQSVPFTHYIAGIRSGTYPPFARPSFKKSESFQEVLLDEFQRELARSEVQKLLHGSPARRSKLELSIFSSMFAPPFIPNMGINKIQGIKSDPIFGLVQEFCNQCGNFKRIEIRYGKNGNEETFPDHDSCITKQFVVQDNNHYGTLAPEKHENLQHDTALLVYLSKIFLRSRIMDWLGDNIGIFAFCLGGLTDSEICMGGDTSPYRYVRIVPTKESLVELNVVDLKKYEWLQETVSPHHSDVLLNADLDSFLTLTKDRTWFFLKLSEGDHDNYYFVMLFNLQLINPPMMVDSASET